MFLAFTKNFSVTLYFAQCNIKKKFLSYSLFAQCNKYFLPNMTNCEVKSWLYFSWKERQRGSYTPRTHCHPPSLFTCTVTTRKIFFINKVFIEIRFPCDLLNEHVLQEINVALTISSICHVTNVQSWLIHE